MAELKNLKHEKFCHLIVQGLPASRAYVEAGFTAKTSKTAEACSSRLIISAKVAARLAELKAPIVHEMQLTTDRIIRQLCRTAFADPRAYVTKARRGLEAFKSISDLTEDQAAAVKLTRMPDGSLRAELRDPTPALVRLGEHMGLFSGESAVAPAGDTIINNDNRTVVYVDRPPDETADQWEARQRARLGVDEPVRRRTVDATNGSTKRGH